MSESEPQVSVPAVPDDSATGEGATLGGPLLQIIERNEAEQDEQSRLADAVDRLRAAIISELNADGEPIPMADMVDCGVRYVVRADRERANLTESFNRMIDENKQLRDELAAAVKLADDRLRTIHGMNAKAKGGAE